VEMRIHRKEKFRDGGIRFICLIIRLSLLHRESM
jgi:hypothetical protein